MTFKPKYLAPLKNPIGHGGPGLPADPRLWTPAAVLERDMYYALLKHRAQAKFRGESHSLTREEWSALWQGQWHRRGRLTDSLCAVQRDPELGWHVNNVEVVPRIEYLRRAAEYRSLRGG
jgi:hypothetical protein